MTLSTLQTMNVPLAQLRDTLKLPEVPAWPAEPPLVAKAAAKTVTRTVKAATKTAQVATDAAKAAAANPAAAIDPTQWWTALSQQFTQLATTAMKDTATDAAKNLAGSLVKQSFDAASDTLKRAAGMPGAVAKGLAAGAKPKPAAKAAKPRSPTTRRKTP